MNTYCVKSSCTSQQAFRIKTQACAHPSTVSCRVSLSSRKAKGTGSFRLCKATSLGFSRLNASGKEESSQPQKGEEVLNVRDVLNESEYWRQQIDRSLHELSGSKLPFSTTAASPQNKSERKPSSGVSEETASSSLPQRASNAQFGQDPSRLSGSEASRGLEGDAEEASRENVAESPFKGQHSGLPNTPLQGTKTSIQEASIDRSKAVVRPAFKWREADRRPGSTPSKNPAPLRPRPKVVEPLSTEGWESMSKLLGMPKEELEQNSAGSGLDFDKNEVASQGPPQPAQKFNKPVAPPVSLRQPKAAPVPVAVSNRKAAPVPFKRPSELVDRSELTKLRQTLNKKLSEANMYNRHLQREISDRDKAVLESTIYLGALQSELKNLVEVAKEIAAGGTKPVTRKINGRYIQSHLASRLEELYSQLDGQLRQVDDVRLREVPVTWSGMAEDVMIMGSFDGWTRGQHLSPETTGSYTEFSAVLQLRPGRYEVKFVVDGTWQLAPSWPIVGDGLSANNILVVD